MRAVIYARYSTDLQREASIEDQVEVCRRAIERNGWTLAKVYADKGLSGASRFRPGYQQMIADGSSRAFDVIVTEALDRFGRKLADVADLHDRMCFAGVKLHAANVGEITAMHIGLLGTMAQLYLSDLREKTWRGQLGRALQGKLPGGKAYGYDLVGQSGERRINAAEAAVVCRIFEAFAAGQSPRAIAKQLNSESVPGPDGRPWGDTTIRGQVDRGTGILNNSLYVGRLEWNRCSYVKNPQTGRRVARVNPPKKREVADVPELRILDDDLWQRVKERQKVVRIEMGKDDAGNPLNRAHRRQFLLSGLLVCGRCGGSYTIIGKDVYGCATRRSKGTCANSAILHRQEIEARVLSGLKDKLLAPELVEAFVREFQQEVNRAAREAQADVMQSRERLTAVTKKLDGIVRAIEDGGYSATLNTRLRDLEAEKAMLEAQLASAGPGPVIRVHPRLPELYREKVERLEEALNAEDTRTDAAEILRGLIDKIVLTPTDEGLRAELHGDLAAMLALEDERASSNKKRPETDVSGRQLSVVAGTCNQLCLLLLHARFLIPSPTWQQK
jgi:DNA invertase Pin-like site-specific DNA recombinase